METQDTQISEDSKIKHQHLSILSSNNNSYRDAKDDTPRQDDADSIDQAFDPAIAEAEQVIL